MQSSRRIYLILFLVFLVSFAIKVAVSFLMHGPFIFSDEACIVLKAVYFASHLRLEACNNISMAGAGDPFPLYSIIISPIYYFLERGMAAYYAILILNSLLVSSLVFPLYSIYGRFLKNNKIILTYTALTIFLSEIVIFEKMLMTECLFIVINVWFLYFYLNSFFERRWFNKLIAIFFAILAALTRPFGFITILAMVLNELILSKRKKIFFIFIVSLSAIIIFIHPILGSIAYNRLISILDWQNISLMFKAFINQLNSFTVASFAAPLFVFLIHIQEKGSPSLQKIRYFLLSFILLNFLISMQHIYGYYLQYLPMDLMTRYINVSLIFIFIFFLIFSTKYKSFKFNYKNILIMALPLLSLLFLKYENIKASQNLDMSPYFDSESTLTHLSNTNFFFIIAIITSVAMLVLFFNHKRRLLIIIFSIYILAHSSMSVSWMIGYVNAERPPTFELLKNTDLDILFVQKTAESTMSNMFWSHATLTPYGVRGVVWVPDNDGKSKIQFPLRIEGRPLVNMPDIIVTDYDLDYLEIGPKYLVMKIYAPKLTARKFKNLN